MPPATHTDGLLSDSRTGYSASYTYDTSGRRTSKTLNSNTENYTYSGGRLTEVGSTTFGYDNNSRRTSMVTGSDTTSYGYDYEDRLTSVTPPGSSAITYVYNGLGSRVGRGSETYRRAGASAGSPMLADGSASYTPGLSERRGGQSSFFHWGSFGDPSALSDGSGDLSDLYTSDWFLGIVGQTGSSTTPIGAGGGYVDPDTGGINHGGGGEYEPWLGGGPSVAQMIQPENGNVDYGTPLPVTNELISEYMHLVLDVVGIFEPTPFCDGINTVWYCAEGDYSNAGISLIGAVLPYAGDVAKVGRLAKLVDNVPTPAPVKQIIPNAAKGRRAELHVLDQFVKSGANAVHHPPSIMTPFGRRFPDIALLDEAGNVIEYIEVKSGGARYSPLQRLKDEWIRDHFDNPVRRAPTRLIRVE